MRKPQPMSFAHLALKIACQSLFNRYLFVRTDTAGKKHDTSILSATCFTLSATCPADGPQAPAVHHVLWSGIAAACCSHTHTHTHTHSCVRRQVHRQAQGMSFADLVLKMARASVESSMLPPNESSISPVPPTTHREKEIGLFRKCCCGCCAFVRRHITHRLSMHTDDGHMLCISGITLYTRNKVCLVGSLSHGGVRTGVHMRTHTRMFLHKHLPA